MEKNDPLSQFSQRFASKAAVPKVAGEKQPYQAFSTKDRSPFRLDVRCGASGLAHAVPYSYLLNISYNRHQMNELFLTVSGLTIMVKGRHLGAVIDAIKHHHCEYIQEFDDTEFLLPADSNQPVIESIKVEIIGQGAKDKG